jgi:predicted nucleic acid-binding Zn ribbon protein
MINMPAIDEGTSRRDANCRSCNQPFHPKLNAWTCSERCRKAYYRKRQRRRSRLVRASIGTEQMLDDIGTIRRRLDRLEAAINGRSGQTQREEQP